MHVIVWGEDYSIILWGSSRRETPEVFNPRVQTTSSLSSRKGAPTTFNPGVQIDVHQVKSISKGSKSLYPSRVQKLKLPVCDQGDLHNLSRHIQ
ncbi:hypothetical protein BKA60DRAFT_470109 [Fusarium oxysporum]|nr:hypothetical protein BKA60DRAFT_470109 [Fusarium oxysporum]